MKIIFREDKEVKLSELAPDIILEIPTVPRIGETITLNPEMDNEQMTVTMVNYEFLNNKLHSISVWYAY